jgi:hypothetical protein
MAAIVNDRDVLLQAASVRLETVTLPNNIIVPAIKALHLTVPSYTFQVNTSGVASPTSILLTASLVQITGSIAFGVIVGVGTLTSVTSNTATLLYSNMTSDSITIRAQVIEAGITYNADITIAKVRDGAGGVRGSLAGYSASVTPAIYLAGTSWASPADDTSASTIIWKMLGNAGTPPSTAHLRIGDTVTLTNAAGTASDTRFWDGTSSWLAPGQVVNGNLLVIGSVAANRVSTPNLAALSADLGTVTAGSIHGTADIEISGQAKFNGATSLAGSQFAVVANALGVAGSGSGLYGEGKGLSTSFGTYGTDSNLGVGAYGFSAHNVGGLFQTNDASAIALVGDNTAGGVGFWLDHGTWKWSMLTYSVPPNTGYKWIRDDGSWSVLGVVASGSSTGTAVLTGKPGANSNSVFVAMNFGGQIFDVVAFPR